MTDDQLSAAAAAPTTDPSVEALEQELAAEGVLVAARALAKRSGAPKPTLVDRSASDAHCDPLFDVPERNAFLKTVVPFLRG